MLIDVTTVFTDFDGNPMKDAGQQDLTLAAVAISALMATYPDEQGLSGDEKVKRYDLAMRIHRRSAVTVDVAIDDIALIKRLIDKAYTPLVVGQAREFLDPKPRGLSASGGD
jgi:hypothetical protein